MYINPIFNTMFCRCRVGEFWTGETIVLCCKPHVRASPKGHGIQRVCNPTVYPGRGPLKLRLRLWGGMGHGGHRDSLKGTARHIVRPPLVGQLTVVPLFSTMAQHVNTMHRIDCCIPCVGEFKVAVVQQVYVVNTVGRGL